MPIAFTRHSLDDLSEDNMRHAVRMGKANTAMMSFASLLSEQEIEAVVSFVRRAFMSKKMENTKYHTLENGWPNHEQYKLAFPFVLGEIQLDEISIFVKHDEIQRVLTYLRDDIN